MAGERGDGVGERGVWVSFLKSLRRAGERKRRKKRGKGAQSDILICIKSVHSPKTRPTVCMIPSSFGLLEVNGFALWGALSHSFTHCLDESVNALWQPLEVGKASWSCEEIIPQDYISLPPKAVSLMR